MEKSIAITYDGVIFTNGELPIPNDYLRLIAMTADDGTNEQEVKARDLPTILATKNFTGLPSGFVRRGSVWKFGPTPVAGTIIRVDYYDEFPTLSAPTDSNYLTLGANDLIIYGALKYAGDYFTDKRAATWEQTFKTIADEIADQAAQDALINAQVSAAYPFPDDD
jgi:hypothetical protein